MTAPTTDPADTSPAPDPVEAPEAEQVPEAVQVPEAAEAAPRVPRRVGVWLAGPLAAVWTAFIGLMAIVIPMIVVWAVSFFPGMGIDAALRTTGVVWLVTHDVAVRMGTATYSLLPWGLMLIWLILLVIAGRWAARATGADTARDGAVLIGSGAVTYGVLLAAISAVTSTAEARTSPVRAFGIGLVLAAIGLTWGAMRGTSLGAEVSGRVPVAVRTTLTAALAGALALVALAAVLAAVALALSFDEALRMQQFLDPGAIGGLALFIIALGYLPSAVMWTIGYALGAGITVGPGVVLSPFIQAPAPTTLPTFPLLATLPDQSGPAAFALPVIGVIAGIALGVVVARRAHLPAVQRLGIAIVAVAIAAIALAVATRISFGSLGDVRLVGLGPSSESVALIAGVLMLVGAVPTALVAGRRETVTDVD